MSCRFGVCLLVFLALSCSFAQADTPRIVVDQASKETVRVVTAYVRDLVGQECGDRPGANELDQLQEATRTALDAMGYFANDFRLQVVPSEDCWAVNIQVVGNEKYATTDWRVETIGSLENQSPYRERIIAISRLVEFIPAEYEQAKRSVERLAHDLGFLDTRFTQAEVAVDVDSNQAEVHWTVDSGVRYHVGAINVQQDNLDASLFQQYLSVQPGDPLTSSSLLTTYEDLLASDYFKQVRVTPRLDSRKDGKVAVDITATPADRWSLLTGFGFATDSGPRVRANATARYLNPQGHRLTLSSLLSPVFGDLQGEYRWPYGDPRHQWYSALIHANYEDTDTAKSFVYGAGVQRTQRLGKRWTWTASLNYRIEDFEVGVDEGLSQLLLFGSNLSYTTSVDGARPRNGRRLRLDVKAASAALASDTDVLQVRAGVKQILPFFGATRWIFRGEIGHTWMDEFDDLPTSLRFFAGGDESVRGFGLDALGPEEAGEVVGGQRLIAGSAEFDFPVRDNWSAAVFTDIGAAFDDSPEFSQSIGIGARWYSPLGPIRIDLAHPLEDSGQTVRLHVSIGPDL